MVAYWCVLFAFLVPQSSPQNKYISNITRIFLHTSIGLKESRSLLLSAKDSYKSLENIRDGSNAMSQRDLLRMVLLMLKILKDIGTGELSILQVFRDINEHVKGDTRSIESDGFELNFLGLKANVESLQDAIEAKLDEHYKAMGRNRHNIPSILALNDSSIEDFLKEESNIDVANIGYFFLEIFATLVGLSWGIISMFL